MSWQLLAVISAVAAGATAVFAKAGLDEIPANLGNAVRTAIVLVLSMGLLLWSGETQKATSLSARTWLFLGLSAVATAVSWVAYFKALAIGSATPVTAIDKASLVVTMALGAMFFGERLSGRGILGALLIVAGSILVSTGRR